MGTTSAEHDYGVPFKHRPRDRRGGNQRTTKTSPGGRLAPSWHIRESKGKL